MKIDGSHGEGGGQIIRTALALSAIHSEPIKVTDIRANRDNPGLKHQHLAAVNAFTEICSATTKGAEIGSTKLEFNPRTSSHGGYIEVDIGTAGSTTLLTQALTPLTYTLDTELVINAKGGTDVKWSPTIDYLRNVTKPILKSINIELKVDLVKRGHYPRGEGEIEVTIHPSTPTTNLDLTNRKPPSVIRGNAQVSMLPRHIASRERDAAAKELRSTGLPMDIQITEHNETQSGSEGTSITLWADTGDARIGGSAIGELGKPAEDVGEEAAHDLLQSLETDGCVDRYTADQLTPYLSITGGRYTASERTSHLETSVWLCNQFSGEEIVVEKPSGIDGVEVSTRND